MTGIDDTLAERGKQYGEFTGHAEITQGLKDVMRNSPRWDDLEDDQREALEMVAHKIGRILNGNPNFHDSWHDCVGYLKLVADRLLRDQQQAPANDDNWPSYKPINSGKGFDVV